MFAFWKALFSVIQGNMNFDFFQMIFMIGLFFKTFQNQFKESCFGLLSTLILKTSYKRHACGNFPSLRSCKHAFDLTNLGYSIFFLN